MERLTQRKKQRLETKQRIQDAADRCFIRKGMAYTLILDICQEAQVSVGTFYHYFKNKNDLIVSRFSPFDMAFVDEADRLLGGEDAFENLIAFSCFFSRDAAEPERRALTIEYLKARISVEIEGLFPRNRPYYIVLCSIIADGQGRKQIRTDMSPSDIADMVMIVTRGYNFDWANLNGEYNLHEKLRRHLAVLFEGLIYQPDRTGEYNGTTGRIPQQVTLPLYEPEMEQLRQKCLAREKLLFPDTD